MGRCTTIYIGVGIKIPTQKKHYTSLERKCKCKTHYDNSRFCSDCGKRILELSVNKTYNLDSEGLIGNDNFFHKYEDGYTIFMSNLGHGIMEVEPENIVQIDNQGIEKFKKEFINYHSNDMKLLSDKTSTVLSLDFFCLYKYD